MKLRFCFLPLIAFSVYADLPTFSYQGVVSANGSEIVADISCASPAPIDWDGDGDLDLLMGEFGPNSYPPEAGIRLFINTRKAGGIPVLTGGELLEAGGVPIALTAG